MVQVEVDRWVAEGMLEQAIEQIELLRQKAAQFEGFEEGHLLRRVNDPHHIASMAIWRSIDDWRAWERSEIRHEISARIAPMLDEPEAVMVLEPLRNGKPSG